MEDGDVSLLHKQESSLISAQAGTHAIGTFLFWIPACAGTPPKVSPLPGREELLLSANVLPKEQFQPGVLAAEQRLL
jgi:hypothetical protein